MDIFFTLLLIIGVLALMFGTSMFVAWLICLVWNIFFFTMVGFSLPFWGVTLLIFIFFLFLKPTSSD